MHIQGIEQAVSGLLRQSLKKLLEETPAKLPASAIRDIELEIPKDTSHGDLTTNISMRLAKPLGLSSRDLAVKLKDKMDAILAGDSRMKRVVEKIDVKGGGFLNFWLSVHYLYDLLSFIRKNGSSFGSSDIGNGKKALLEFVSANPTGPLTIAHGRQAAVGDALGNIMRFCGYRAAKEYYVNDEGRQIDLLGASLRARYLELNGIAEKIPEDGYMGDYLVDIAKKLKSRHGKKLTGKNASFFSRIAVDEILDDIKKDLKAFGVRFDSWFYQSRLTRKKIESAIGILKDKGHVYEKDGATWFRSTGLGDDKDRVVIKSDGSLTYLAPDIAYHLNKYKRKNSLLVDIWGPDHHGYISRLKAAVEALGYEKDTLAVLLVQLATLYRDGVALSMSTRKGEFITLKEVVAEIGKDVTRFILLTRKLDSHLDFDLGVAKKESKDNPVYYIQYAHARIWSILDFHKSEKSRLRHIRAFRSADPRLLKTEEEVSLLRKLVQFPIAVKSACATLEPYRVIEYLSELSKIFHNFYNKHRVVSDDAGLTAARLLLAECIKITLANGLRLVGISLPKRM